MTIPFRIGKRTGLVLLLTLTAVPAAAQFPLDLSKIRDSMTVPAVDMVVKTRDGRQRAVTPGATSIMVAPGDYVVAKTGEGATKVSAPSGSGIGYQLPVTIATVGATGTQIALGIVVRAGNGLMPRSDGTRHEGRIYVGVVNTLDPVTVIALHTPVQVTVAGPVESITPDQPKFESTNVFLPVTVIARNPRDPVELKVSTGFDVSETTVPLAVFDASVSVMTSMSSLAGFGFETVDLTVQVKGIPNLDGMPVSLFLHGGAGSFRPGSQLRLDANGRATATLRTSGLAPAVVVAASLGNGATAQADPISYTWPVAWMVFAIGGGVIGGTLKQLTGTPRSWLATIIVSVLMGFLSAALYTVGVSIIPTIPAGIGGQLVVAVIAALGALGGVGLLPIPARTGSR